MTTCLVLGGVGFIGSHIAELLVKNGYYVRIFDKATVETGHNSLRNIEYIKGDFFTFSDWGNVLRGVDYVFHNICTTIPKTSDENPIFDIETNVVGNVRFLREIADGKIRKLVFSSSGGTIYGEPGTIPIPETHPTNPITSYGISKLSVEKYLHYFNHHCGLDSVSLRYANAYGPGQNPRGMVGAVAIFLRLLMEGKPVTVFGDGSVVRDYVYIDDIARANLYAIQKETSSKVFNVGTGKGTSLNELIQMISEVTGRKMVVNYASERSGDVSANVLDISLIRQELNWEPEIDLREGIARVWDYIRTGIV